MLLTVILVTFNHEKFVAQALDSVLMQNVPFSWEIIVADDASTDKTKEIIEMYRRNNTGIIHFEPRDVNVGIYPNFIRAFYAAKGKYIAFLDGDDFWTDPEKLLRQVESLESNPDATISAHFTNIMYQDLTKAPVLVAPSLPGAPYRQDIHHMLSYGADFRTASMVIKKEAIGSLPQCSPDLIVIDRVLVFLALTRGDAIILPYTMATYRVHNSSSWTPLKPLQKIEQVEKFYAHVALWSSSFTVSIQIGQLLTRFERCKALLKMRQIKLAVLTFTRAFFNNEFGDISFFEKLALFVHSSKQYIKMNYTTAFQGKEVL